MRKCTGPLTKSRGTIDFVLVRRRNIPISIKMSMMVALIADFGGIVCPTAIGNNLKNNPRAGVDSVELTSCLDSDLDHPV